MNLNKKLSDILDPNKIEVVKNPIEKAHGLPNECYLNNDYLEFEKEKIFKNNWTMIGVASSVPNPGDAKPFNLLGIPILIVRNKENEVKVFHNVCSHRGFKLVDQECKLKNVIRCPYHSWSYDTDGKLVATPHIGGMNKHDTDKFDKSINGLKEIRSYVWLDLIMINISNNEIPFEKYIKPLSDRWKKFWPIKDRDLIVYSKDYGYFNLNANGNPPWGGGGFPGDGGAYAQARYPSAMGNADFPYAIWNEYTAEGAGYGGRPYFTYDEFEWGGGSFAYPLDVDVLWNSNKDLWVGSPEYSTDGSTHFFNVVYNDWTRSDRWLFHSEAYDGGYIVFGEEIKIIIIKFV